MKIELSVDEIKEILCSHAKEKFPSVRNGWDVRIEVNYSSIRAAIFEPIIAEQPEQGINAEVA